VLLLVLMPATPLLMTALEHLVKKAELGISP